jgi:hypothetical protein
MQFGTSANPATVCVNAKNDAVQISYYALMYNDIRTAEFETIVHLELYGSSLYNEEPVDILRQLVKFHNLETISLLTPPRRSVENPFDIISSFVEHAYSARIMNRASELDIEMKNPQYDNWKKPLLNRICPRDDGSRFTEEGEFNPAWSLGVSNTHSRADFAKSTMSRRLEELRRNRGTQAA